MTVYEKADSIIERIQKIYENYTDDITLMLETDTENEKNDDLAREIARAQYNFEKISELYELDPYEFAEKYGDIDSKENIDILIDWLLSER